MKAKAKKRHPAKSPLASSKRNPEWSVPWIDPARAELAAIRSHLAELSGSLQGVLDVLKMMRDGQPTFPTWEELIESVDARYYGVRIKLDKLSERQDEIARDIAQIQKYVGVLATQALAIDDAAKRARADQYRRSIPTLLAKATFDMDT